MRLDRLLREEEALADLAVHEPVRDELQDLDLAHRRFLLSSRSGAVKGITSAVAFERRAAAASKRRLWSM